MKRLLTVFLCLSLLCGLVVFRVSGVEYEKYSSAGLDYTESTRTVRNPMVGYPGINFWYMSKTNNTVRNNSGFMHYFIDISAFSGGYEYETVDGVKIRRKCTEEELKQRTHGKEDIPISDDALQALDKSLLNLRNNHGTCLIRVSYSADGGEKREPYDFNMVLTHTKQLCEIYTKYSDVVGGIEIGMVGPFGEMWGGPYANAESIQAIAQTLIDNTPNTIKIMGRKPEHAFYYICDTTTSNVGTITLKDGTEVKVTPSGKNSFYNLAPYDNLKYKTSEQIGRLGMFNDGYMLTEQDTGTFTNREEGLKWLSWASEHSYYGGEYGSLGSGGYIEGTQWYPENALPEMYRTHLTYIHGNIQKSTMSSVGRHRISFKTKEEAQEFVDKIYAESLNKKEDDDTAMTLDLNSVDIVPYPNEESPVYYRLELNSFGYDIYRFNEELSKLAAPNTDNSAYYGYSVYKFMRDHLGYRLVLRSSEIYKNVKKGGVLNIKGTVENTGFGNVLQDKICQLVIAKDGAEEYCIDLKNTDANSWLSQNVKEFEFSVQLPKTIESGEYDAYIRVCNVMQDGSANTGTTVEFANKEEYYDGTLKANLLGSFNVTDETEESSDDEIHENILFDDVSSDYWGYKYVNQICQKGIMSGMSPTTFQPDTATSRAMIVKVLYNMEGQPSIAKMTIPFTDIPTGQWYTDAVIWAFNNEVTAGTTDTTFSPNSTLTREQFAAIMYRYASKVKGYNVSVTGNIDKFTDKDSVSDYAITSMTWAVSTGLITGMTETTLGPKGNATRAQMATIIIRFLNKFS